MAGFEANAPSSLGVKTPRTVEMLKQLDELVKKVREAQYRLTDIADRVVGAVPAEVAEAQVERSPSSIDDAIDMLTGRVGKLHSELNRF